LPKEKSERPGVSKVGRVLWGEEPGENCAENTEKNKRKGDAVAALINNFVLATEVANRVAEAGSKPAVNAHQKR
jgi:hypothetical protein